MRARQTRLFPQAVAVVAALMCAFGLSPAIADLDDAADEAEEEARDHPFIFAGIVASTAATTGVTLGDAFRDNDYARARDFAESRFAALRRDAATGSGENLRAFAELLNESQPEAFGRWMQANYATVFDGSGSKGLVDRVVTMRGLES